MRGKKAWGGDSRKPDTFAIVAILAEAKEIPQYRILRQPAGAGAEYSFQSGSCRVQDR